MTRKHIVETTTTDSEVDGTIFSNKIDSSSPFAALLNDFKVVPAARPSTTVDKIAVVRIDSETRGINTDSGVAGRS